jgi:hypothetical protein
MNLDVHKKKQKSLKKPDRVLEKVEVLALKLKRMKVCPKLTLSDLINNIDQLQYSTLLAQETQLLANKIYRMGRHQTSIKICPRHNILTR